MRTINEKEIWKVRLAYKGQENRAMSVASFDHRPSEEEIKEVIESLSERYTSVTTPLIWSMIKKTKRTIVDKETLVKWERV